MLTITMHDRPLAAWVPATASNAARARFLRHHLHFVTCTEEAFFTDEMNGDCVVSQFAGVGLLDLPEGGYTLHGGDGELYQMVVTPIMICLEGIKVIDIPSKQHRYVPAEHVTRVVALKSMAGRTVHVWTSQHTPPVPPGGTYEARFLEYRVLLDTQSPHDHEHRAGPAYTYLGVLDLDTGAILPGPGI